MEKIPEFLQVFVNSRHHGKEEDLPFRAQVQIGIHNEGDAKEIDTS